MNTKASAWKAQTVGDDRALVRSSGSARMVFGLGPRRGFAKDPSRLSAILGGRIVSLGYCHQIHGREIHTILSAHPGVAEIGRGDGLITTLSGIGLLVWTADCVPMLLESEGVIAAIHSGWRGCAADIVGAAVNQLQRRHGVPPNGLHAALGPAVCGACYQVGPEVPDSLRSFELAESRWLAGNHVDLRGFLSARLEAIGVPAENIETVGGCTVESNDLASFRRDGEAAGRQWSMVYLER